MGLVGQHRHAHPRPLQRGEHLRNTRIGRGLVLFVGVVICGMFRNGGRQLLPAQPLRREALHQIGDAVAHHALELVHRMGGPAMGLDLL